MSKHSKSPYINAYILFINKINHIKKTPNSVQLQLERRDIKKPKYYCSDILYRERLVLYLLQELLLIFLLQQSEVRVVDVYGSGAAEVPRVDSAMTR